MRASCLTFGRRHTLRVWRPRELKPGPSPRGPLKSLGCRSRSDRPQPKVARGRLRRRRSSPMRKGIALVAPPRIRPAALATPPHTLFQQPAGPRFSAQRFPRALSQHSPPRDSRRGCESENRMSSLASAFVTREALAGRNGRDGIDALAALVERAREGDGRAFDRLMLETQERVVGVAWRLLG